jgi:hypothetical protein
MKKLIIKKLLCLVLAISVFYTGCAGREANPIPAYLPGDENRSCASLNAEMAQLQSEMQRLLPKTNKLGTNTLWAIGGVLFIVPFFFMDLKDAEKIEYDAFRARYNRLLIIAAEKQCDLTGVSTQELPSFNEQKAIAQKVNKEISKLPKKNQEGRKLIDCKVDVLTDGQYKITPVYEGDNKKISSENNAGRFSSQIQTCNICGKTIQKLEQHFIVDEKITCKECFSKLENQEPVAKD